MRSGRNRRGSRQVTLEYLGPGSARAFRKAGVGDLKL